MRKSINEILGDNTPEGNNEKVENEEILIENGSERNINDDITSDPSRLEYRRGRLKLGLARIRDEYMGYGNRIAGYVEDENGRLDEDKMFSFINELIGGSPMSENLSAEERQLIEDFLYCAIAGPSVRSEGDYVCHDICYEITGTFSEIMDAARDPIFSAKSRRSYLGDEVYTMCYPEYAGKLFEFLYLITDTYDIYSAEEYRDAAYDFADITGADRDEVLEEWGRRYADAKGIDPDAFLKEWIPEAEDEGEEDEPGEAVSDEAALIEEKSRISVCEAEPAQDEVSDSDDINDVDYEEDYSEYASDVDYWEQSEREWEFHAKICQESNKKWEEHLPENDQLKERYLRFRKNVFSEDVKVLVKDMEKTVADMIDNFIMKRGLSPICSDKGFGLVDHELDRCLDAVKRDIKRIR